MGACDSPVIAVSRWKGRFEHEGDCWDAVHQRLLQECVGP
jgi:hypothetical protein